MKKIILLTSIIPLIFLTGCMDSKEVAMVKSGSIKACPSSSMDEMVSSFMSSPSWDDGISEDGAHFVNIEGGITYNNKDVNALIQFIVKADGGTFEFNAFELNSIPQNMFMTAALLKKMCASTSS